VESILATLRRWQHDPVPEGAQWIAHDLLAAHYLSWRAGHLRADEAATDTLTRAWQEGVSPPDDVGTRVVPREGWPDLPTLVRGRLLELRYHDPARFLRWRRDGILPGAADLAALDAPDAALACGDHEVAAKGYRERIAAGWDPGAWSGLALIAWRHSRSAARRGRPVTAVPAGSLPRPELACAVHQALRARGGRQADPGVLLGWTARRRPLDRYLAGKP
jgi:hypothetical protein